MATNSSRKGDPKKNIRSSIERRERASSPALDPKRARALFEIAEVETSLPNAILDGRGNLLFCNVRMAELLGLRGGEPCALTADSLAERWPFFNETRSSRALFQHLSRGEAPDEPVPAEAGLKTFRLKVRALRREGTNFRFITAELVRRGDLLADKGSRQTLFRSLSHEIRTSVTALKGYLAMMEEAPADRELRARMERSLNRLESVVKRLDEFKTELGVDV